MYYIWQKVTNCNFFSRCSTLVMLSHIAQCATGFGLIEIFTVSIKVTVNIYVIM